MKRTVGHRAGRAPGVAGWLPIAATAVLIAGCAASTTPTPADRTGTLAGGTAGSSVVATGDRLTATVTYSEGQERFDPLPASYRPKITAKQAFDAFASEVDPRSLGTDEKPTVLLASYTNFITGKHATFVTGTMDPVAAAKSDEASKPWWTRVPVWYTRYRHVEVASAGPPAAPGKTYHQPGTVVEEMVIPVSADTGKVLMMENNVADRTPTSWPPPVGSGDTAQRPPSSAGSSSTTTR